MDKTDVKQKLKLAKEEFMKKNFSDAAKLCKTVLTFDSNNIPGLILYGASLLEISSRKDESIQQFQKAVDISPKNIFAWQGVEQYYEKCDKLTVCQQLFYTYANLLCLETDGAKCMKRALKCIELWKNYKTKLDLGVFISTVLPIIENEEITPQFLPICRVLVEFPFTEDTAPLDEHLEKMYLALCDDDSFDQRFEVYCKLIPLLKSKGKRHQLVDTCEQMLSMYNNNAVVINFFCESFISNYIKTITDPEDDVLKLVEKMSLTILDRCEVLLVAQPTNPNSLIAKSIALRRQNEFEESRKLLRKVLQVTSRSWQSWFLLTEIQIKIHYYDDVILCVQQAKKIMKPTFSCYQTMLLWEIEAYCCSQQCCNIQGRQLAIDMFSENSIDKLIDYIIIGSCHLNDEKTAKNFLNTLQNKSDKEDDRFNYLEGLYFGHFGHLESALRSLKSIKGLTTNPDALLVLGNVLWKQQKISEAGKVYLEASRIAPYRCDLITKLGHYYREIKHLSVAVACYEKSVVLNPDDEENGLALSDAYISLSKSKEQEALLNYLKTSKNVKWAALRLGVHYLKTENYELAVDNLQLASKHNPDSADCYECLGDALMGRGSLIGAKLTYSRCIEIDPVRLYPRLQCAKIEYRVGQVDSSVQLFCNIVSSHPDDFNALLSASRVFVEHARSIYDRQPRTSCDLCRNACEYLSRALLADNRFSLTWKLLGDACLFLATMPGELARVRLSCNVFDRGQVDYEVSGAQLYAYSRRCYSQALNVTAKRPSLNAAQKYVWYDLAACYLKNASDAPDVNSRLEFKSKARQAIGKCVLSDPANSHFWNAMGTIEAVEERAGDQHLSYCSFVRSLKAEPNAVAYNNLGVKCLTHGDADLAREAFTLSQHLDPTLPNSWVGLGLLAQTAGDHTQSVDLFYHATTLGHHPEAVCGYTAATNSGDNELLTLNPPSSVADPRVQHNIDALLWLCASRDQGKYWALNALSVLYCRAGLHQNAVDAAIRARDLCTPEEQTVADRNLAYALLRAKQYEEAVEQYFQMRGALNVHDKFGYALAYYKTRQYVEAYATYDSLAMTFKGEWFASVALLGMASVAFGRRDDYTGSTTLLLRSIQTDSNNVQALFAAFALGIVTRNSGLSSAILRELVSLRAGQPESVRLDIVRFEAYFHYLNRQPSASLRLIGRAVHERPGDARLWMSLGSVLLNYYMANSAGRRPGLASQVLACAATVGRDDTQYLEDALVLTAVCNLFEGQLQTCLRNVLRGVHLYPTSASLWTVLLNAVYCRGDIVDAAFLRAHVQFIVSHLGPDEHLKSQLLNLETQVP